MHVAALLLCHTIRPCCKHTPAASIPYCAHQPCGEHTPAAGTFPLERSLRELWGNPACVNCTTRALLQAYCLANSPSATRQSSRDFGAAALRDCSLDSNACLSMRLKAASDSCTAAEYDCAPLLPALLLLGLNEGRSSSNSSRQASADTSCRCCCSCCNSCGVQVVGLLLCVACAGAAVFAAADRTCRKSCWSNCVMLPVSANACKGQQHTQPRQVSEHASNRAKPTQSALTLRYAHGSCLARESAHAEQLREANSLL